MTSKSSRINFHDQQKVAQIEWRKNHISTTEYGIQNGKSYKHIIPRKLWEETLWQGIRNSLKPYLDEKEIQSHTGTHNLLSSWIACANLYFPVRAIQVFKPIMLAFLQKHIFQEIKEITETELEFAFNGALSPEKLLGEKDGSRGSGQTSPDVAFLIKTKDGKEGIILTECKYTEHSFYACSARKKIDREGKPANPDPARCISAAKGYNYKAICHQTKWERKYWDNLNLSEYGESILKKCPASTAGYQLLRQQSLAEGIAKTNNYGLIVTSVAYDGRNEKLKRCLRSTGLDDFSTDWGKVWNGKVKFATWTHQDWVAFVRNNGISKITKEWAYYMKDRYGY